MVVDTINCSLTFISNIVLSIPYIIKHRLHVCTGATGEPSLAASAWARSVAAWTSWTWCWTPWAARGSPKLTTTSCRTHATPLQRLVIIHTSILQEPINKVDHYCDVTIRSSPRGWAWLTTSPTPSTTRPSWGPCWRRSSAPWRSPPTSQPSTRTFCSQQPRSQTRATPPSHPTTPWCRHPGTRGGHRKLNLHQLNQWPSPNIICEDRPCRQSWSLSLFWSRIWEGNPLDVHYCRTYLNTEEKAPC